MLKILVVISSKNFRISFNSPYFQILNIFQFPLIIYLFILFIDLFYLFIFTVLFNLCTCIYIYIYVNLLIFCRTPKTLMTEREYIIFTLRRLKRTFQLLTNISLLHNKYLQLSMLIFSLFFWSTAPYNATLRCSSPHSQQESQFVTSVKILTQLPSVIIPQPTANSFIPQPTAVSYNPQATTVSYNPQATAVSYNHQATAVSYIPQPSFVRYNPQLTDFSYNPQQLPSFIILKQLPSVIILKQLPSVIILKQLTSVIILNNCRLL